EPWLELADLLGEGVAPGFAIAVALWPHDEGGYAGGFCVGEAGCFSIGPDGDDACGVFGVGCCVDQRREVAASARNEHHDIQHPASLLCADRGRAARWVARALTSRGRGRLLRGR